tara:strand:- start:1646 stop:1906 length:261 start_codon:yes stop_codon:yes gene_type:complete
MKPFDDFTRDDLHDFISDYNITKKDCRGGITVAESNNTVINYKYLSELLSCTERNARAICDGAVNIRKHHYDLLSFHTKTKQAQLV